MPPPVDGPAVGLVPPMPPLVAEKAGETAYAVGPARAATIAAATDTASSRTFVAEPAVRRTNSPTTARTVSTATMGHSQVFQPSARRSSTTAQTPVTARPAGSTQDQRASPPRKARHSSTPPPPHSAAIPGARAVV